jgi:uncharacterized protein
MLPVFPLPSTVVFPGMRIPLYVFENRYKRLVKYCLEQDEPRFVIALARQEDGILDGVSPFARVGTIVRIVQLAENPDGTYNLLGYGQDRCRTDRHQPEEVAEADGSSRTLYMSEEALYPLERGDPNLERVVAWDAIDTFRDYAKTFFAFDALRQIEEAMPDDLVFQASFICANIRVPVDSRQVLLEAPSLSQRFQIAQKLMQERLAAHRPVRE